MIKPYHTSALVQVHDFHLQRLCHAYQILGFRTLDNVVGNHASSYSIGQTFHMLLRHALTGQLARSIPLYQQAQPLVHH